MLTVKDRTLQKFDSIKFRTFLQAEKQYNSNNLIALSSLKFTL